VTTYRHITSPLGPMLLTAGPRGLAGVYFTGQKYEKVPGAGWVQGAADDVLGAAERQIEEYFAGRRAEFDVPLDPRGTPFQLRVWEVLRAIPYGQRCTYRDIATRLGSPSASRAVGGAVGHNPLSIIVPCHRVVGADGSLTGYAGGLDRKRELLALESRGAARG
jgi:methylated-DNA-[protein]-cysteine S-methyltransferase